MSDIHDGPIFIDVGDDEPAEICVDFADNTDQLNSDSNRKESRKYQDVFLNAQNRRYRCSECNRYSAETEEKLQRHIKKVHRGENPFQCYMCEYSTYNSSVFEEHLRVHQGIKPYKCSKCPYRSVSKKNTKKHELIHRPDNPLKCTQCDFIARHSRSLLNHIRKHDMETVTEFKEEKDIECKRCDFIAHSRSEMLQHKVKMHTDEKKIRYLEDVFTCEVCGWSSRNRPKILLHIIHHPNQYIDENVIDVSILKKYGIIDV
ncbi:PREDICTED: zinc finger protein 773-like isoform X2 [Papilio polytes]|uniref:zinc finger protein 773-like isoform X2 n=1 Tax=Papilio polytes TaxID=76194 RepID=UPI000675BC3A|nr:PREDICTED: zinc finger protein 773-like isoform X2 [Papilio polytes]